MVHLSTPECRFQCGPVICIFCPMISISTSRKWNSLLAHFFAPSYDMGSFKRGVRTGFRLGDGDWYVFLTLHQFPSCLDSISTYHQVESRYLIAELIQKTKKIHTSLEYYINVYWKSQQCLNENIMVIEAHYINTTI